MIGRLDQSPKGDRRFLHNTANDAYAGSYLPRRHLAARHIYQTHYVGH